MDEKIKMRLEESCLPVISSGEYVVTAQTASKELGKSEVAEEHFFIEGPRFCLNKEDVVSVYPGSGMKGSFGDSLPHIVLGRKTLPWERSIEPEKAGRFYGETDGAPTKEPSWLCVLLLWEGETADEAAGMVGEVCTSSEEIYFPELYLKEDEKQGNCSYIDIEKELFLKIVPTPKELALLSHARQVEQERKAKNIIAKEEWLAFVVGNRLPKALPEGAKNRAYLVSLEGFGDYQNQLKDSSYKKVRLVVLHKWEFYAVPEPFHFREICTGLDIGRIGMGTKEGGMEYQKIAEHGFRPLLHHLREGSRTVSFYRGPLSPVRTATQKNVIQAWCADELYRYDPEIGMFDISYAAAWQLGRMLALQNQAMAQEILKLRSVNKRRKNRLAEEKMAEQYTGTQENGALEWLLAQLTEEGEDLL